MPGRAELIPPHGRSAGLLVPRTWSNIESCREVQDWISLPKFARRNVTEFRSERSPEYLDEKIASAGTKSPLNRSGQLRETRY